MLLQDKIQLFLNKAQSKICELSLEADKDLNESYLSVDKVNMSIELIDITTTLQDETLNWTDKEIESVIDYYTWRAHLNDVALLNFENKESVVVIVDSSTTNNDWVPAYYSLNATVIANHNYIISEVARLDDRIDNLDFSGLVPQELIDEVEANSAARHTHNNKSVLDQVAQSTLNDVASSKSHTLDGTKHVTNAQKFSWDAKVDSATLNARLNTKANVTHVHEIQDVNGLEQALIDRNPVPGPAGQDGLQPVLQAGTITDGSYSITIDSTNPATPILNLVVPKGQDGTDFHIDEYKLSYERLSIAYNTVDEGYSILGTDNGVMYYRRPYDSLNNFIPATTSTGWYAVQFAGANGWSPVFAIEIVNETTSVYKLVNWVGGTGTQPNFVNVYVTPHGYSPNQYEATNIRGPQGIAGPAGKVMFPDQSGDTASRTLYDNALKDFVFLDTALGLIYIKRSDVSADWSDGYQWKGDTGPQGPTGDTGATGAASTVPGPQGPVGETGRGYTWKGQWVNSTPYVPYDVVFDLGSSYNCISPIVGGNNPATNISFELFAAKGEDGVSVGGGHTIKDATTTLAQKACLKFIGNVSVTNDGDNTVVEIVDSESIFFDDITVKAKISRPYNFTISAKTESGGTGTITTSLNAAYTLGATITANDYVQVTASAVNTIIFLTLTRV